MAPNTTAGHFSPATSKTHKPFDVDAGKKSSLRHDQTLFLILLSLLGFLCILNLFLIHKIWGLEYKMSMKHQSLNLKVLQYDPPSSASDWLHLLERQEVRGKRGTRRM